jgi:signal transduction histidine kinase
LKTPIQPILGYAELLLQEESDDKKRHALMGIVHNSERLQKLASDILDITKIESKTFRIYKKSLNLNSVIANIVKDYVRRIEQSKTEDITRLISSVNDGSSSDNDNDNNNTNGKRIGPRLVFESKVKEQEDIFFVEADEERLAQVICNIVDNALKFTDADGNVIVTVGKQQKLQLQPQPQQLGEHIEQRQPDQEQTNQQYAIITIKDTGTGIHPEIFPRLFSKFATKSHRGTGLGLYISKNIIEAHGGKLYATNNNDGKGATFTIVLPLVKIKE